MDEIHRQTCVRLSTIRRKQPLHRLIFGLGIRFIGVRPRPDLAQAVKHLLDFLQLLPGRSPGLEDVGPKVARRYPSFLQQPEKYNHAGTAGRSWVCN